MERKATCGCGNVKVTVKGDPELCFACHCDFCQKMTGSIANFGAVYKLEDFLSIEGDVSIYDDLPKWPGAARSFCTKCGTTVHWVNPMAFPGMRMVAVGCFSDPSFPGPEMQVQTKYRHPWCGNFEGAIVNREFEA